MVRLDDVTETPGSIVDRVAPPPTAQSFNRQFFLKHILAIKIGGALCSAPATKPRRSCGARLRRGTDRMRQGRRAARLHPEKRLSGDSTKTSHFARTSAFPIDMREYVAQAGSAAFHGSIVPSGRPIRNCPREITLVVALGRFRVLVPPPLCASPVSAPFDAAGDVRVCRLLEPRNDERDY